MGCRIWHCMPKAKASITHFYAQEYDFQIVYLVNKGWGFLWLIQCFFELYGNVSNFHTCLSAIKSKPTVNTAITKSYELYCIRSWNINSALKKFSNITFVLWDCLGQSSFETKNYCWWLTIQQPQQNTASDSSEQRLSGDDAICQVCWKLLVSLAMTVLARKTGRF